MGKVLCKTDVNIYFIFDVSELDQRFWDKSTGVHFCYIHPATGNVHSIVDMVML